MYFYQWECTFISVTRCCSYATCEWPEFMSIKICSVLFQFHHWLTLFPPVTSFVICFLYCLCSQVAYIANNMDPDHTAPLGAVWSGFIVFAPMIKLSLKWTWIHAADNIFRTKNIGGKRVNFVHDKIEMEDFVFSAIFCQISDIIVKQ